MSNMSILKFCCAALCISTANAAFAEKIFPPFDGFPGGGDFVIVGDGRQTLRSPKSVFLRNRATDRVTILWADRTDVETGYRVDRRDLVDRWTPGSAADWQEIATTGPQDGFPQIVDTGLMADQLYCYRVVAVDDTAEIPSAQRCVFTPAAANHPVFRIQLQITTADIRDAGTDDDIEVLLNSRAVIQPVGNNTWIDYSRDDFEQGDVFAYDLDFTDLRRISDITQIFIDKRGSNDWCVSRVSLMVNELEYFEKTYSDLPDGCHWLKNESDGRLIVPFHELRGHARWGRFDPAVLAILSQISSSPLHLNDGPIPDGILVSVLLPSERLGLLKNDMRSRIEGIIGDIIATQPGYWMAPASGQESIVELVRADLDSYRVSFGLKADGPAGLTADIFLQLDLDISASCNEAGDRIAYAISTSNFDVSADFEIWWLENNIEDAIRARFPTVQVSRRLPLEGLPEGLACIGVPVTISQEGDVEITLLLANYFWTDAPDTLAPVLDGQDEDEAPDGPVVAPATKKY